MFSQYSLHDRIVAALNKYHFIDATPVQQEVLPLALQGKDLQVCAETGSGKTLAYGIPMLERLLASSQPNTSTRALILVPTRELARQVFKAIKQLTDLNSLDVGVLTGGEEFKYQASMLRKNPEIIVSTPGRLVDHLKRETADLGDVEYLVLDEADRMLDMGFSEDLSRIVGSTPANRQTLMLSATLRHSGVGRAAKAMLNDPTEITTQAIQDQHSCITQQRILADDNAHKDRLVTWLLANESFDKAVIFVNKRDEVERLGDFLRRHRNDIAIIHGEMSQDERNYVMQALRDGRRRVLVATDVAARGLDIDGLDLVINYDLARKGDEYVHRIGRTGRAGREGLAISLIADNEWNLKASIERYLQQTMDSREIPGLKAKYRGPKKVKASGKAAGTKKKTKSKSAGALKKRSVKKAGGPRPSRPWANSDKSNLMDGDGFAPITRKKNS